MNLPPCITNNPNILPEVINFLQAGRLGSTVFVANVRLNLIFPSALLAPLNITRIQGICVSDSCFVFCFLQLDYKVGWKKLKEVFSMAGTVKRADVKEDKDGKSRGMGTVTFERPLEAVQLLKESTVPPKVTDLQHSIITTVYRVVLS
uniref:RRM domain-containing protein n=1 Tax=Paramormyrops kingsleyae TaxID=1676925 RepID=A0A3B3QC31_9TELE